MKRIPSILAATSVALFFGSVSAEPLGQQLSFTPAGGTIWNIDWNGVSGRTYFIQCSLDLENWGFAPIVEFETPLIPYGTDAQGVEKYFVRLVYYDDPSITTLEQAMNADFDNDGVSNIDEVSILLTSPVVFSSDGSGIADGKQDWDSDGISNADEIALGLDPGTNDTDSASGVAAVDFGYDDANRLVGITSPVGTETFDPDQEGNLE